MEEEQTKIKRKQIIAKSKLLNTNNYDDDENAEPLKTYIK